MEAHGFLAAKKIDKASNRTEEESPLHAMDFGSVLLLLSMRIP
jgi:hypothetical protein